MRLGLHKKSNHCLKSDHDSDLPLTSINVKMTSATTSRFWLNSSKPFTRSSVLFLSHTISFIKSERWARKIPEIPLGTSSTKTLLMLASLFLEDYYLFMEQILQPLTFTMNKKTRGQLQDFNQKPLRNMSKKNYFVIPLEVFQDFWTLCYFWNSFHKECSVTQPSPRSCWIWIFHWSCYTRSPLFFFLSRYKEILSSPSSSISHACLMPGF